MLSNKKTKTHFTEQKTKTHFIQQKNKNSFYRTNEIKNSFHRTKNTFHRTKNRNAFYHTKTKINLSNTKNIEQQNQNHFYTT